MNNMASTRPAASSGKAGVPDASRPLDTGAVTKRLQQELMSLMASGGDGVSAFPAGDSLFDWVGTITVSVAAGQGLPPGRCRRAAAPLLRRGQAAWPAWCLGAAWLRCLCPAWPPPLQLQGAEGTAYEGCTFRLSLKFTSEYPFKPPTVRGCPAL